MIERNLSKGIIRDEESIIDNAWLGIWEKVRIIHAKLLEEYMRRSES